MVFYSFLQAGSCLRGKLTQLLRKHRLHSFSAEPMIAHSPATLGVLCVYAARTRALTSLCAFSLLKEVAADALRDRQPGLESYLVGVFDSII